MRQIVIATDFSNCAANAMEYALKLAKILKVELCAIHAIGTTEGTDDELYNTLFIEDYYNNKRRALAAWTANYASKPKYKDVRISTFCEVGSLSAILNNYIESHQVLLLVMGTMGATGISSLLGSNASAVVSKTSFPTLVIPLKTKFASKPLITLATDFSAELSAKDTTALNELILAFKSRKLNVLNILKTREWKTNETGEQKMKELIMNVELEFNYTSEDNAKNGIMNFIQSNQTDILCLVKQHHNFIYNLFNRSTVTQVMEKPVKAVLVLHSGSPSHPD